MNVKRHKQDLSNSRNMETIEMLIESDSIKGPQRMKCYAALKRDGVNPYMQMWKHAQDRLKVG